VQLFVSKSGIVLGCSAIFLVLLGQKVRSLCEAVLVLEIACCAWMHTSFANLAAIRIEDNGIVHFTVAPTAKVATKIPADAAVNFGPACGQV